jgi:hypothetical protein
MFIREINFLLLPLAPLRGSSLPYWRTRLTTQFIDLSQSVGLLGRVNSSSQDLYLNTGQYKHRKTRTNIKYPCPRRDSNCNNGLWAIEDCSCLRTLGYRDRQTNCTPEISFNLMLKHAVSTMYSLLFYKGKTYDLTLKLDAEWLLILSHERTVHLILRDWITLTVINRTFQSLHFVYYWLTTWLLCLLNEIRDH